MKLTLYLTFMIAGLLFTGCGEQKPAATTPAKTNAAAVGENPLTAPVDYLGALNKAQKAAEKVVDAASINKAIELFQANEERYPTNLNELVAKRYFSRLPEPPYGMKFEYDPKKGQVSVVKP